MSNKISYTKIASILLKQINKIRVNPKVLIAPLQQRLKKYNDSKYYPLDGLNFSVNTIQGKNGVNSLINFLQNQRQCPKLQWSYDLHKAAHKRSLSLSNHTEQQKLIGDLVSQFTNWKGHLVQLNFYGFIDPKQFICQLLIEDGHEAKQNREQFFNHMSRYIGIGISTHAQYRFVIVMIYSMQVVKKQQKMVQAAQHVQRNSNIQESADRNQNEAICKCEIY